MRLLITTQTIDKNDPILGFFHRWVIEFAQHFERVDVICLKAGSHTLPPHVYIHSLGKETGESRLKYTFRFYRYFWEFYMTGHVDYVFFHMGAIYNILAAPFFLVRKLRGTRFYWWKTHGKLNFVGRAALTFVDEVVTAGNKSFNAHTQKVRVIGHAIDTEALSYTPASEERPALRLLSVGRITPIKKIEIALRAFDHYVRQGNDTAVFHIVGPIGNSTYFDILETQIRTNDLVSKVAFLGEKTQAEMQYTYTEYDVLLHPAYEAGFDKVVLEAMAVGVIPITSIPSFEPVLAPFGLYVEAENSEQFVAVLTQIRNMGHEERSRMRQELRTIVVKSHSLTTLPARIFGVL